MRAADEDGVPEAAPATPGPARAGRAPGIKDVAAAAGVSWKTVSNVVNGTGRVGAATRERVERTIAELGYRPSLAGRQLRRGRTNILALAVPEIDSPYFGALAHAVIVAARERGYRVFIDETRGDPEAERSVARGFDVRLIDGIVFSPLALSLAEADRLRGTTPMVLLGERDGAAEPGGAAEPDGTAKPGDRAAGLRTDHVSIDNVLAAREATRHLLETGRRRLGFLGAESAEAVRSSTQRLQGFREELDAAGTVVDERWVLPVDEYHRAAGARAVEEVLARVGEIDGLLCGNDQLALGAMHALRRNGVAVPADVAVVGWDNTEDGRYANPSLTTVAPDVGTLAEHAVRRVVAQVEGDAGEPEDAVVAHRLLVRESTRVTAPA